MPQRQAGPRRKGSTMYDERDNDATPGELSGWAGNHLAPDTLVAMSDGSLCPIEDITEGDTVLTHRGQFGRVDGIDWAPYAGQQIRLELKSHPFPLTMTPGQQVLRVPYRHG